MVKDYQLDSSEKLIIKGNDFRANGFFSNIKELLLTSQNLVIIWDGKKHAENLSSAVKELGDLYKTAFSLGLLKSSNSVDIYSLNEIKAIDSDPEVFLVEKDGTPSLEIYFTDSSSISITRFEDGWSKRKNDQKIKDALIPWYNALINVIKGHYTEKELISNKNVNSSLSMNNIEEHILNNPITKKCTGCGAPVIGLKGQTTICNYCDTTNYI